MFEKIEAVPSQDLSLITNQEDFYKLKAKDACILAYKHYKSGKWSKDQFDTSLRAWWRKNHPSSEEEKNLEAITKVIEEAFN